MRFGYSILLREFTEAEEVEFGDCELHQIVCPACRDPIFKKTRGRSGSEERTHFLSHYAADGEDDRDCELRCAAIGREHLAPFDAVHRKQTLQGFFAVLREAVIRGQEKVHRPGVFRAAVDRLMSRPVFDDFLPYAREGLEIFMTIPDTRKSIADTLGAFPRFEGKSPFWLRRQASYLQDVIDHILAPGSKQNMRFIAAAAYVHIGLQAKNYRASRAELEVAKSDYNAIPGVDLIEALVMGKSKEALRKAVERISGVRQGVSQVEASRRVSAVYRGIMGELIGPMIGLLGAVPFPDLARDNHATMAFPDAMGELRNVMDVLLAAVAKLPQPPLVK